MSESFTARVLQLLLVIEAVIITALTGLLLVLLVIERPSNLTAALFEIFFALAVAATLWKAALSRHLRSAAILINIIALPISRTLFQSEQPLIALPVGALAFGTLVALFLDRKSLA